jgi:hypothetical protein
MLLLQGGLGSFVALISSAAASAYPLFLVPMILASVASGGFLALYGFRKGFQEGKEARVAHREPEETDSVK